MPGRRIASFLVRRARGKMKERRSEGLGDDEDWEEYESGMIMLKKKKTKKQEREDRRKPREIRPGVYESPAQVKARLYRERKEAKQKEPKRKEVVLDEYDEMTVNYYRSKGYWVLVKEESAYKKGKYEKTWYPPFERKKKGEVSETVDITQIEEDYDF